MMDFDRVARRRLKILTFVCPKTPIPLLQMHFPSSFQDKILLNLLSRKKVHLRKPPLVSDRGQTRGGFLMRTMGFMFNRSQAFSDRKIPHRHLRKPPLFIRIWKQGGAFLSGIPLICFLKSLP